MADQTPQINTNLTLDNSKLIVHVGGEHVLNILLDDAQQCKGVVLVKDVPIEIDKKTLMDRDVMIQRLKRRRAKLEQERHCEAHSHYDTERWMYGTRVIDDILEERYAELRREMAEGEDE
ncbi:MAG: hypothetical protein ACXQS4_02490 [Methermicoccaceae archaeon]